MSTQYKIELSGDCITQGINRAIAIAQYMNASGVRIDVMEYDVMKGCEVKFPIFASKDSTHNDLYNLYRTKSELEWLKKNCHE